MTQIFTIGRHRCEQCSAASLYASQWNNKLLSSSAITGRRRRRHDDVMYLWPSGSSVITQSIWMNIMRWLLYGDDVRLVSFTWRRAPCRAPLSALCRCSRKLRRTWLTSIIISVPRADCMAVGAPLSSLAAVYSRVRDERATQLSVQFALARVRSPRRYRSKRAAGDVLAAALQSHSVASVPPHTGEL